MSNGARRDNDYFLRRIEAERPDVWAYWKAGKFRSVREARQAAGMLSQRTRLHELKNAWSAASADEKRAFVDWLRPTPSAPRHSRPNEAHPVAIDRKLEPWAENRISEVMHRRRMERGDVMAELGFKRLDTSLWRALARGSRLSEDLILALERWLDDNAGI